MSTKEMRLGVASLRFGPLLIRFRAETPEPSLLVREPHVRFLVDDAGEADIAVACAIGEPRVDDFPIVGAPGDVWELRRADDGREQVVFRTATATESLEVMQVLSIAADRRSARLVRRPSPEYPGCIAVSYPVDEHLATRLLHTKRAVVVHAASVLHDGIALLFIGHSGAGKSTMAEMAEALGATVLSDDRTILTVDNGVVTAWGTPWHGSYTKGSRESAPVRGAFLLRKSDAVQIVPLEQARTFAELFVRRVQPALGRGEIEVVIGLFEQLSAHLHLAELFFPRSVTAFEAARAFSRSEETMIEGGRDLAKKIIGRGSF